MPKINTCSVIGCDVDYYEGLTYSCFGRSELDYICRFCTVVNYSILRDSWCVHRSSKHCAIATCDCLYVTCNM